MFRPAPSAFQGINLQVLELRPSFKLVELREFFIIVPPATPPRLLQCPALHPRWTLSLYRFPCVPASRRMGPLITSPVASFLSKQQGADSDNWIIPLSFCLNLFSSRFPRMIKVTALTGRFLLFLFISVIYVLNQSLLPRRRLNEDSY